MEREQDNKIAMLDTLIEKREDGTLKFQVYRKPTHTDQYLQFDSHQPLEHKLGVIRSLTHRAKTLTTEEQDKDKEIQHIKKVLSISGYKKWSWDLPGNKKILPHPRNNSTKALGHVTIPYIRGISEAISRKFRSYGISTHTRPINTLRSQLCHPKDKEPINNRCGVVYQIECNKCEARYVGETERALKQRISEHRRTDSPVGQHMRDNLHELEQSNVTILDRESRWFERGVREAIEIRGRSPSLNRDQGRHQLPNIYNSLIQQSRDTQVSRDNNK